MPIHLRLIFLPFEARFRSASARLHRTLSVFRPESHSKSKSDEISEFSPHLLSLTLSKHDDDDDNDYHDDNDDIDDDDDDGSEDDNGDDEDLDNDNNDSEEYLDDNHNENDKDDDDSFPVTE